MSKSLPFGALAAEASEILACSLLAKVGTPAQVESVVGAPVLLTYSEILAKELARGLYLAAVVSVTLERAKPQVCWARAAGAATVPVVG